MLTLKLYALRDRLLDYYKQPFLGPGDKTVMASLANMINNEGDSDFVQAPHHFELWTLAEVHESGEVIAAKEFICDCAGLVRKNLRDPGEPGDYTRETTPPRRTAPPSSHNQHAGTQSDSPEATPPAAPLTSQ